MLKINKDKIIDLAEMAGPEKNHLTYLASVKHGITANEVRD